MAILEGSAHLTMQDEPEEYVRIVRDFLRRREAQMASDKWLEGYDGQTTDELLALETDYRIDSIVLAFEQAIGQKAARQPISKEERYVLAVEALEREVNNGGYSQFFLNSSHDFVDVIEEALLAIGCPKTAAITSRAMASLGVDGELTGEKAEAIILADSDSIREALDDCDEQYFENEEPIANRLFAWIKRNRALVSVGNAGR